MRLQLREFMSTYIHVWRVCGIWFPSEPSPEPRSNKACAIVIQIGQIILWFTMWVHLSRGVENMTEATDVLTMVIIFTLATIKGSFLMWNTKRMQKILRLGEAMELTTASSTQETEIINQSLPQLRIVRMSIVTCGLICCTMQFLASLLAEGSVLLHAADFPYDIDENKWAYYCTLIYQYIFAIHTSIVMGALETAGPILILMLKTYLVILNARMRALGWNEDKRVTKRKLRECFEFSKSCARFGRLIEEIYGLNYLLTFSISGIGMCATAYVLSTTEISENPSNWVFMLVLLMAQSQQIFLPCYCGTMLYYESDLCSVKIYEANWIEASPEFKSSMLIFVTCTQKAVDLKSLGGLYSISLPTFVATVKAAYSMLSCLTQME